MKKVGKFSWVKWIKVPGACVPKEHHPADIDRRMLITLMSTVNLLPFPDMVLPSETGYDLCSGRW